MLKTYEIAFLIKEGEIVKQTVERIKEYFSKIKANLVSENDMGTRHLAYKIHRNREDFHRAFYYFARVEMDTTAIPDFEKKIKFDEDVIRYMIVVGS